MIRDDPNLWQFPKWDPVWDGEFQFENLSAFATSLLADTDLAVRLDVIEVGYARLAIFAGTTPIGEVFVNRSAQASGPLFAIFAGANGDELQTTDVAAGIRFLSMRREAFPEAVP